MVTANSRVQCHLHTVVQLEAPGTVGAPEFAEEPGAVGVAGGC